MHVDLSTGIAGLALLLTGWQFFDNRRQRKPPLVLSDVEHRPRLPRDGDGNDHFETVSAVVSAPTPVTIARVWIKHGRWGRRVECKAYAQGNRGFWESLPFSLGATQKLEMSAQSGATPNDEATWLRPGTRYRLVVATSTKHEYESARFAVAMS